MEPGCLACELSSGARDLPGGSVHATDLWVVEHCIGPLSVGTLILKPIRHCVQLSRLTPAEAGELGPLLQRCAACVQALTDAEQVYSCLWSHQDWVPVHIHFVVQPSSRAHRSISARPGPFLQVAQFSAASPLSIDEVGAFCERARAWPGWTAASSWSLE